MTPIDSGDGEYWLFYDRSEVARPHVGDITTLERNAIYERRINLILQSDQVISSCKVIEGSVNFGEPGSGGAAKVKCTKVIPLEKDGLFNGDGSPNYRYYLKRSRNK
jgi:hypothetical protein